MPNAKTIVALTAAALALGACQQQPAADQNISISNGAQDNQMAGNADIEMLPADESSTTPTNELQNGFDSTEVNEPVDGGNSY